MTLGAPGRMIANRYRLEGFLGQGGYGEVWKATDTHRGHVVALKLILNRNRHATWREASLLTALKDDHILEVNNADVFIDLPYLDTALAQCSLDAKAVPLGVEPGQAVDWMRRALRGLDLCHRRGLLHRDVKPANLFLSLSGDAKLGDFGIAAAMDSAGTASPEGDAKIRAPELYSGGRASVASDVYSAGFTLYVLLTGRVPFDGIKMQADLEAAVLAGAYEPIRDAAPHISQELADRVKRAMALDPAQRFGSAAEFDSALALRARSRIFIPAAPCSGHLRCWTAAGSRGALMVCTMIGSSAGRHAVEVRHVSSGNRVKRHCLEAKQADFPAKLRKVFNALR